MWFKCFWCGTEINPSIGEGGNGFVVYICKFGHEHYLHQNGTCDAVPNDALEEKCEARVSAQNSGCIQKKFPRT